MPVSTNKCFVYEIVNLMGTVEHVGETIDLKERFWQHKSDKFKNRADVFMNVVNAFDTKDEAFHYQQSLLKEYGLPLDGAPGGLAFASIKRKCPHCSFESNSPIIFRYHFDKCKNKI